MRNEFHRMLSIRGTNFIACWACAEMFKSWISRPNRIRFSKISCYRPLGQYGFGFCKKSLKKLHACVPLIYYERNSRHRPKSAKILVRGKTCEKIKGSSTKNARVNKRCVTLYGGGARSQCGSEYFTCIRFSSSRTRLHAYITSPTHRVHRVVTAAFWHTFSHEGKIRPGWWGWGVHAHPLSLYLPSPVKLQCTLQLSGQIH
jgi:hypothetical protein